MTNLLGPVVGKMSLNALLILALFASIIMTNFMSNTVAATIVTSVFVPLAATFSGVSDDTVIFLAIAISCLADSACCTLEGSVTAGVAFGDDIVPYNQGLPPCLVYSLLVTVATCILLLGMSFI